MKPAILIVDDSMTVRMDLEEAFEHGGFVPTLCATLAAARHALATMVYALVVLDVMLPDGDGVVLLKEIRLNPKIGQTPVLLLSTAAEVADRVRGLRVGANEYVGKPYDINYLISRARELIRGQSLALGRRTTGRVLFIDDSITFRQALTPILEQAGYEVTTASTGEEGLRLASDLRPNAIIVDSIMPGIDGPAVIRRLKLDEALRRTPCILLTAFEDRANELRALESGADAYVHKEAEPALILARLAAALRTGGEQTLKQWATHLGPKRILAVDDSPSYLNELGEQLRHEGHNPILVRSGEEALEMLSVQTVDCVLLDLIMPGLSGLDTCRQIKNTPAWRDIPLIVLTTLSEAEGMVKAINAGADDFITKSADFEVLKARLRAQLRRRQLDDENRRQREELLRKESAEAQALACQEMLETRAALLTDLAARNNELKDVAQALTHDLREPLGEIAALAEKLETKNLAVFDAESRQWAAALRAAAQRASQRMEGLLKARSS